MFFTSFDSFFSSFILYRSIERFVAMKKLKSSPNRNEKAIIDLAFWNVSLISSAERSLRNNRMREFSDTCSARHDFSG